MTKKEALSFIDDNPFAEYFCYGDDTPVLPEDAYADISGMDEELWSDGEIFICDENGNITE